MSLGSRAEFVLGGTIEANEATRLYYFGTNCGGGSDYHFACRRIFDAFASPMIAPSLLSTYPLVSDQVNTRELGVILRELEKLLATGRHGSVVEFGCYVGTTSLFIRRLLEHYRTDSEFHVYDSFEGLPKKTIHDISIVGEQFQTGVLCASKNQLLLHFKKANLEPPVIHKQWFSQIQQQDIPQLIYFAFLDGDYFESIIDSLRLITPNLQPGATIIVDDYANEALPGAAKAVDQWLLSQPQARLRVEASLAIITL